MPNPAIKVLNMAEFQATLEKYVQYNKREFSSIVNTKAYRIAVVACAKTYRPPKGKIAREISELVEYFKRTKSGRTIKKFTSSASGAPIAALLINWARGKRGKKGLQGADMAAAVKKFVAKRENARAFLASGWIPAIKRLAGLADRGSKTGGNVGSPDSDVRRIQNPKGSVIPATGSGTKVAAKIINEATSKPSTTFDPLGKYGLPALQAGVDAETASMRGYIEGKMRDGARQLRIKTN